MWYQRAVEMYDGAYRVLHGLERPSAQVPPVLRLEVRRSVRRLALGDGTVVRLGDRVGVLHLDNRRLATVHARGSTPLAIGLEFRRELLASLRGLAHRARPGGSLADVVAFSATTILHHGLPRIGFERDPVRIAWPRITTGYQLALLATLHPNGWLRAARLNGCRSERLWISRRKLLALYGVPARRAG